MFLDLFLPDNDYNSFELGRWGGSATYHLPNGDIITMESKCVEADLFFNQYRVSYFKYEKWRNGVLVQTELQRYALRWYGVEEFKYILESIGFSNVTVCADFDDGKNQQAAIRNSFIKLLNSNHEIPMHFTVRGDCYADKTAGDRLPF